jgi:hypothetical protein
MLHLLFFDKLTQYNDSIASSAFATKYRQTNYDDKRETHRLEKRWVSRQSDWGASMLVFRDFNRDDFIRHRVHNFFVERPLGLHYQNLPPLQHWSTPGIC